MRVKIQAIAFALMLAAFVLPTSSRAQDASKGIKVEVTGFRNNNGRVGCSLWSGPAGFPRDDSHIMKHVWAPIKNANGECVFNGTFSAGDYAITLFHDEDSSGKFKSNFVGYPLEGYGFSNNVVPQFSAPTFDQCKFHYDGTGWKQIPVKMIYR
ncbi:MAG: DUF2141 domain-containing protein [Candidatus Binatus sp.]|uniref:DUF2141 domain-containing protein n=1 Tax=Candidatus Binatus sp. TaxID=2811406 RepID=UPI003C7726A3